MRFYARNACVGLVVALSLSGCMLSPYVDLPADINRPGVVYSMDGKQKRRNADGGIQTSPVTVAAAREYGRFLQDAYRSKAQNSLALQATYDFALISIATTAVGLASIGGNRDAAEILGLTAAGGGLFGNRYLNTYRRRAYFRGAIAMECVIGNVYIAAPPSPEAQLLLSYIYDTNAKLNSLVQALPDYEKYPKVLEVASTARANIFAGKALYEVIDPIGQVMLSKIESIRLLVDLTVAESEPNLVQLDNEIKSALAKTGIPDREIIARQGFVAKQSHETYGIANTDDPEGSINSLVKDLHNSTQVLQRAMSEVSETNISGIEKLFEGCSV